MKKFLSVLGLSLMVFLYSNISFASALGNFNASTVTGGITNQRIFARANLTMVNVWATFCAPCLEEIPILQNISQSYNGKGFQIVGIVADTADQYGHTNGAQLATAKKILNNAGATYTNIIPIPSMNSGILGKVGAVPTTFFVDKEGNQVGELYLGAKSKSEWIKIIESLKK